MEVDGILDEVRVSSVVRDACWLETEYGNQNDPGSFYILGNEEQLGQYTISATAQGDGVISPAGFVPVVEGTDKTFTITPDNGYKVSEVFVDTISITPPTDGQYTFSNVTADHSIFVTFEVVTDPFGWSVGDFDYRKQISISSAMLPAGSCSSSLTNYPVLIKFENDNELKAHAQSNGYDIVFKLGDGTPLNHEVEDYDAATGSLVAWVRIPSLSNTTDTNIYMYYGNELITSLQGTPTYVWDFANYEGVWHLNESPDDNVADGHKDSTSNANHGRAINFNDGDGGTTDATGLIAGADKFAPGGHDIVSIPDGPGLDPPGDMTMEAWIRFNSFKGSTEGILYKDNWNASPSWWSYQLNILDTRAPLLEWVNSSGGISRAEGSSGSLNPGTWYYLVGVHDGNSLRLYLNGNLVDSATSSGSLLDAPGQLNIGSHWTGGTESPDATIDEVRTATAVRSVCWIQTSYNNMLNPGAYITVGGEEGQGATHTIIASAGAGGSISPLGSVTVAEGSDKTFTVSPASGYQVDAVLVDDAAATLTGNQYTFTNVTGAHSIEVTFVISDGDYGWDGGGDFLYRRPLIIDGARLGDSCSSDLTSFPVLVQITGNSDLMAVSVSGHVYSQSGDDIVFKSAGDVVLPHELTHYDKLTGAVTAWVRVPALTKDENYTIYMYYGNPSIDAPTENPAAVWDVNYVGVWHLNEAPDDDEPGHLDSTSYNNIGTPKNFDDGGGGFTDATGKIGGANYFKGDDDWIEVPSSASLDITGDQITLSAWVRSSVDQNDSSGFAVKSNGYNYNYQLGIRYDDRGNFRVRTNGSVGSLNAGPALAQNQWYFIYGIYNGYTAKLYLNGVEQGSLDRTGNIESAGTAPLVIGRRALGDPRFFDGIIDEVRVSNTSRSTCWMETEYSNQNDPAAFISLGAEEAEGAVFTITASAGTNGSISPAGAVTVADGGSRNFFLVADEGYQVNTVAIGGDPATSYAGAQYLFTNVTADTSIEVTFKAVVVEPPPEEEVPPGCAKNITIDYGGGFDTTNLNTVNTDVDANGYVNLNTGNQAIDPNHIIIPFRQEVAVYFMYEGAGYDENDFGWMLAADGIDGTKHEIYQDVNDTNDNGVLDLSKTVVTNRYGDINGDGVVNALDNRQVIGTFNAGTELVFYLKVDDDEYDEDHDYADEDDKVYFYTKTEWNQDTYRGGCDEEPLIKTYYLGRGMASEGECLTSSNWMADKALTRVSDVFGLNFGYDDTAALTINQGQRFAHVMVGAPADQPNAWVLGWEDLVGAGDTDHNDMVFIIERETGGTVQLKPEAAISPADADGNINGVTIGVYDYMPGGSCLGQTDITYYLSIDAGDNWVEVTGWDEVYDFTLVGDGRKFLGAEVTNWTPGAPPYTYRTRRVDFAGLGLSGNELIWRADFKSQEEGCEPKIIDLSLDLTVSTAGNIARSTPTVLANVLYSGSMETPAVDWTSTELRGHLKCTQIYDPADPSQTSTLELWDAGDVLKNQMEPDDRNIYTPNVTVQVVDAGSAQQLAVGDGVTTTFSGRLANYPALATTVRITDQRETFADQHTDDLDGSLGGSGWINRFTGEYRITFNDAPNVDQPITATYSYFTYNAGAMRPFIPLNVTNAELGIDSTYLIPGGYIYDFNGVSPITDADGDWLVEWVRGYKDGSTKSIEKEWVLGAVDHSVPAVATPPAASPWYYGTAFPEDKIGSDNDRKGYRTFRDAQVNRRTVVYVGARDGMLHAFDAGAFGWTDDDNDTAVDEYRGLFDWTDLSASSPAWCADVTDCPDYGTGRELWAFIPANLLPRLKNNYLQGDDQAYVDASPALADVFVNGAWRTVLLSAEGNGGDTVFCLDVTVPDAPQFMWEFADPELFRSRSSPSVAQIGRIYYNGTTKWVAFFVSGKTYDDTLYPSIYVIDIADGSVVEKIVLDAEAAGAGGVLSGQPTIVDSDGNGYVDRLYIGSDKGLLYKINMPDDPDTVKYGINHCVINTDFTDTDTNEVPDAWHYQPIYGSPTVVAGNSVDLYGKMTYDIRIFFGTGDSPYYDEDINFADTRYFFYAYRDTTDKGVCDTTQVALDWFFQLPEGHRIWASAFAAAGNIYFGTSTGDVEDPCDMSGNSGSGFDANAGKLFAFNINNPNDGPILERVVGNVLAAPVVEDKHLYVQSVGGDIDSFGSGQYNSKVKKGGIPQIQIHWWREIF